jgi:hypothetical protein
MKLWAPAIVLVACHGAPMPQPLDLGSFRISLEGRRGGLEGNALYGRCLLTAHIFLVTNTVPKASFTIHPMGAPAVGRHPFRPLPTIQPGELTEPSQTGPYSLEVSIPPDTVFEADSGWINLETDAEDYLRGIIEAWVSGKGGAYPHRVDLPERRLRATFIARRERNLEPSLAHGTECAQE